MPESAGVAENFYAAVEKPENHEVVVSLLSGEKIRGLIEARDMECIALLEPTSREISLIYMGAIARIAFTGKEDQDKPNVRII